MDTFASVIKAIAWPATVLVLVVLLRSTIADAITRIKGIEGPAGWKFSFQMRKISNQLEEIRSSTQDLYNLTGAALNVREKIYQYVATILRERVSPHTAFEMRRELNKYHLAKLNLNVVEVKKLLQSVGRYSPAPDEQKQMTDEITQPFVDAVLKFQEGKRMPDADGIVGSKTYKALVSDLAMDAQQV